MKLPIRLAPSIFIFLFSAAVLLSITGGANAKTLSGKELTQYLKGTWQLTGNGGRFQGPFGQVELSDTPEYEGSQRFNATHQLNGHIDKGIWAVNPDLQNVFIFKSRAMYHSPARMQIKVLDNNKFESSSFKEKIIWQRVAPNSKDTRFEDQQKARQEKTLREFMAYLPGHWTMGSKSKTKWHFSKKTAERNGDYQLFIRYPTEPDITYRGYWRPYVKSTGEVAIKYRVKHPTRANSSRYGAFSLKKKNQKPNEFTAYSSGGWLAFVRN